MLARRVTHDQLWICILLTVGLLATNPLTRADGSSPNVLRSILSRLPSHSRSLFLSSDVSRADVLIVNDAVYAAAIYLYLMLAAHSYRVFDPNYLYSYEFYAPKIALVLFYLFVKLALGFKADVSLGLIPFSRLLTWILLAHGGRIAARITFPVLVTTILDCVFGFWLVREVALTASFLSNVSYVNHRAKQLGFRCFVYQTMAFCFNIIGLSLLIIFMLPRSYIYYLFDNPPGDVYQLEPHVARLGLALIYFTWTLIVTYVNLPPTPILPSVQQIITKPLFFFRNTQVGVWLGLADIVATEDAEDSSDGEPEMQETDSAGRIAHHTLHGVSTAIPIRYRHRELFDEVPPCNLDNFNMHQSCHSFSIPMTSVTSIPSHGTDNLENYDDDSNIFVKGSSGNDDISSIPITSPIPIRASVSDSFDFLRDSRPTNIGAATSLDRDTFYSTNSSRYVQYVQEHEQQQDTSVLSLNATPKRLRLRKNLFVMETQALMVNASYLSYIPGNVKEEMKKPSPPSRIERFPILYTGSLSADLDDLDRQIEEENRDMKSKQGQEVGDDEVPLPEFDDGTWFLVDPHKMAERYGYTLYKHVCDEDLNTHAVVLVSSSRVVVAFSGTRDVTNWGVNANINRVVLDDKLTRLEYNLSEEDETPEPRQDDLCLDTFNYRNLDRNVDREFRKRIDSFSLRPSHSSEELLGKVGYSHLYRSETVRAGANRDRTYGTTRTSLRQSGTPMFSDRSYTSRTRQGVSMVANTLASELLTFGKPKVHEGFINAYMALRQRILGTLVELYRGKKRHSTKSSSKASQGLAKSLPVFFCGHSLGGALATFASYEAARYYKRLGISRRQDISCTTFGCPKIGNDAFKSRYERLVETHWRFEIAGDPIPIVPTFILNYVHVGVQVLIDQSGVLLIDPSFIEVQWWGRLANLYMGYRLHSRASYCKALKAFCKHDNICDDDLANMFWPFPIRAQTKGLFHQAEH